MRSLIRFIMFPFLWNPRAESFMEYLKASNEASEL